MKILIITFSLIMVFSLDAYADSQNSCSIYEEPIKDYISDATNLEVLKMTINMEKESARIDGGEPFELESSDSYAAFKRQGLREVKDHPRIELANDISSSCLGSEYIQKFFLEEVKKVLENGQKGSLGYSLHEHFSDMDLFSNTQNTNNQYNIDLGSR